MGVSGVHALLSFVVTQRAKEIGIRMALGATVRGVIGLVLGQSLRLAAVGIVIGSIMAIAVTQLRHARLLMMRAFDGVAYASGVFIVLSACVAAAGLPALRAARVNPVSTLRHE
jgi:putative ABC transport system permease protein